MSTHTIALKSLFNGLRPDQTAVELWIGALKTGDYKQGFGLLRDADNLYDPFGVLAEISGADWTWNAREEAWAIGESTLFLTHPQISKFLGCRLDLPLPLDNFLLLVAQMSDEGDTFEQIAETLLNALGLHRGDYDTMNNSRRRSGVPPFDAMIVDHRVDALAYSYTMDPILDLARRHRMGR